MPWISTPRAWRTGEGFTIRISTQSGGTVRLLEQVGPANVTRRLEQHALSGSLQRMAAWRAGRGAGGAPLPR